MKKILVVEDEKDIQNIIKAFLENAEYKVETADDGLDAINFIQKNNYDLILLDIMLPKIDGFTVCEMIRKNSNIPIIILTALTDEESQLKGFDKLADDYITKPFHTEELLARITVQLRQPSSGFSSILTFDEIRMDTGSRSVEVHGNPVRLTRTEYAILKLLMQNPAQVITKSAILDRISEDTPDCMESSLKVHVSNLRRKLKEVNGKDYIEAVWGIGFKMNEESI